LGGFGQAGSEKPVARQMRQRRHPNVVAVALANKNARIAWSLLASDSAYDASLSVGAA
jgi:hypothetical protein